MRLLYAARLLVAGPGSRLCSLSGGNKSSAATSFLTSIGSSHGVRLRSTCARQARILVPLSFVRTSTLADRPFPCRRTVPHNAVSAPSASIAAMGDRSGPPNCNTDARPMTRRPGICVKRIARLSSQAVRKIEHVGAEGAKRQHRDWSLERNPGVTPVAPPGLHTCNQRGEPVAAACDRGDHLGFAPNVSEVLAQPRDLACQRGGFNIDTRPDSLEESVFFDDSARLADKRTK